MHSFVVGLASAELSFVQFEIESLECSDLTAALVLIQSEVNSLSVWLDHLFDSRLRGKSVPEDAGPLVWATIEVEGTRLVLRKEVLA